MTKKELAQRLYELDQESKIIEAKLKKLKDEAKKIGSFSTKDFDVVVDHRERDYISLQDVRQKYGDKWRKMFKDCVKVSEFQTVAIRRKAA